MIASGIRGPGWKALLQAHRLNVFIRVFGEYIEGKATVEDVRTRALKVKEMRRKRPRRLDGGNS